MNVSLGGDRIGTGNKMKVHLHGYERSTFNLSYIHRTTMSAGTVVPFLVEVALPGDTHDIDLEADIKTHPTIGPLFGSFKAQWEIYLCPIRLYIAPLHNNMINIGRKMSDVKLPQVTLTASDTNLETTDDLDNCQMNPSSLPPYLGIRGVGLSVGQTAERDFNALPILMYWDIIKCYHSNKQEEIGAVIHTPAEEIPQTVDEIEITNNVETNVLPETPDVGVLDLKSDTIIEIKWTEPATDPIPSTIMVLTQNNGWKSLLELCGYFAPTAPGVLQGIYSNGIWGEDVAIQWRYKNGGDINTVEPKVVTFPLSNIDGMRAAILSAGMTQFKLNDYDQPPYTYLWGNVGGVPNLMSSQEGLAVKTYLSDVFNNWLNTEWIDGPDGVTEISKVSTTEGSFSIDTLNLAQKIYKMMNRIMVGDGTYNAWQDTVWAHKRYVQATTPMFIGGMTKELVFQEVVSNSNSDGQPLGTLAGKGIVRNKKGGKIRVATDEPSYIIGLMSLTPRIDYSQGNRWDTQLKTMDDFHKPQLDQIGFQELITEKMAWWSTTWDGDEWQLKSAGKQPSWIDYMTNYNRTYGNFAIKNNEMFMTLNRRYEYDQENFKIKDLTTYIDPVKYNFIFAETQLDAQNYWVQTAIDMTARRKMSAKVMPNL